MTSTIGIPIKLLNEAQVRYLFYLRTLSSDTREPLNECANANNNKNIIGPHCNPGNHIGSDLPREADRGRGQHERAAQGHHGDGARRPRQPSRAGLHPWQPCTVLYCTGHVEVTFFFSPSLSVLHSAFVLFPLFPWPEGKGKILIRG